MNPNGSSWQIQSSLLEQGELLALFQRFSHSPFGALWPLLLRNLSDIARGDAVPLKPALIFFELSTDEPRVRQSMICEFAWHSHGVVRGCRHL